MVEKRKEEMKKREVWDCGSSLYDSFELKCLEHQLSSAMISGRSMSMPHLSDRRLQPPAPPAKKHSRISRSLHKLVRSVFRTNKHSSHDTATSTDGRTLYVYDMSGALSTIPETLPEFDGLSPEMKSLVTRSRSDRFMSTSSLGISCV